MKVAIFSTSRADFGIFEALLNHGNFNEYHLFVGGMHLLDNLGKSLADTKCYNITETFDFLSANDTASDKINSLAKEYILLREIFQKYDFDAVMILGDRFELIPIVHTALIYNKVILHLHGGEITEGAMDEQIRHMITKAAHLHFAACEKYAENIKKMGEESWRVHNVGALGMDNMLSIEPITKTILFNQLGLDLKKELVICTYHPVTLEFGITPLQQFENMMSALDNYKGQILMTAPNIDLSYSQILQAIESYSDKGIAIFVKHLGVQRYLSLISHSDFVIGNSSSGILEVPYYKIPTINIGDRQKGRIRHKSVIDTEYTVESIQKGMEKALDPTFRNSIKDMEYKFGDGHTAEKIIDILKHVKIDQRLLRKRLVFGD